MLKSGSLDGGVNVALNVALPPAGTVMLGVLNATAVFDVKNDGAKSLPPVASAFVELNAYVTASEPLFVTVNVCVEPPDWLSPSATFDGDTPTVEVAALSTCTMPAPWRCTLSRKPSPGLPNQ